MAELNVTPLFTSARPVSLDLIDKVTAAAAQLDALLACTYGQNGESFRDNNDEIQDSYMWACSDIASNIKALVNQL
jgi:hypothetical protein